MSTRLRFLFAIALALAAASCAPYVPADPGQETPAGDTETDSPGTNEPASGSFTEDASLSTSVRAYYGEAYGLSGSELKAKLQEIVTTTHDSGTYAGLWTMYGTTDVLSHDGSTCIWDIYSSTSEDGSSASYWLIYSTDQASGSTPSTEGVCYNREHSWPQNTFNGEDTGDPEYSDGHHIVPTDVVVNNKRSNYAYGEVGTYTWISQNGSMLGSSTSDLGYTGMVFEPIDCYKGDIARMHFYMALRYYNDTDFEACAWAAAGAKLLPWYDDMLREWAELDPVSAKELARNDAVAAHQGNRNPFIDYPELIDLVDLEH